MAKKDKAKKERLSMRQRAETHSSGNEFSPIVIPDGLKKMKVKSATTKRWSIIPFKATSANPGAVKCNRVGMLYPERAYWVHSNVGPENRSVPCPYHNTKHLPKDQRKRCPICDHRNAMLRDPDANEDEVKALNVKERQIILILDEEDRSSGLQVFDYSFHGFAKQLYAQLENCDPEDDEVYYADPETGMILRITFEEKPTGGRGSWYPCSAIAFKKRTEELPDDIINHGVNVDAMVKLMDYDELSELYFQTSGKPTSSKADEDDEDDDEDDDKPAKKSAKKSPSTSSKKPVDDDDDEDDEDEDDEDEVPAKPAKKSPAKKPIKKVDADDDDDDDDEDDDVPARKSGKRPVPDDEDDDDDDDDDDDNEDDEDDDSPPAKKSPTKKPAKKPADDEDDDDEDDDEDDDDEDEPPAKKGKAPAAKSKPAKKPIKSDDDDDDDEDDDDDDDDEFMKTFAKKGKK